MQSTFLHTYIFISAQIMYIMSKTKIIINRGLPEIIMHVKVIFP